MCYSDNDVFKSKGLVQIYIRNEAKARRFPIHDVTEI